jgi:cyanate lyase
VNEACEHNSDRNRAALTDAIIDAKIQKNPTFEQINEGTGLSLAFVTAALPGQHALPEHAATVAADPLLPDTYPAIPTCNCGDTANLLSFPS